MDSTNLANLPYTDPPDPATYRRAARTLARMAGGDTDGLREVLEAIGYPGLTKELPRAQASPDLPPRPKWTSTQKNPYCKRGIHEMSGANVMVDSSGRRCRECRLNTDRARRARGER